jgi:serine/threonine protein kinase
MRRSWSSSSSTENPSRPGWRQDRCPSERAWEIAGEVARALVYAHSRGVLHLDLKSENIVVLRTVRVKVLDFGLAGLESAADSPEAPSRIAGGTPATMAPEQELGAETDARADLWAVGVVLHQMLFRSTPGEARTGRGSRASPCRSTGPGAGGPGSHALPGS